MISSREIAKQLYKESKKSKDVDLFISSFFTYLKKNKLEYLLPGILKHLELQQKREKELDTPKIFFGKEPTEKTIQNVKSYIDFDNNNDIVINIQKDLVGGFIAEYKGIIYDGSIKNYIKNLRSKLSRI